MKNITLCLLIIILTSSTAVCAWLEGNPWIEPEPEADCTTALVPGWATSNDRPLLWKSRDVSNWHQVYRLYDTEPYAFIGLNYPFQLNEFECYGGINEVGFAIENSNALNFSDSSGYDDDGIIMYHALQTCETVEDFLAYMDTTARFGRTRPSCYGVFDAYGGSGILEAAKYDNYWFDGSDPLVCPEGYLVRSNFAYEGGTSHIGQYRHDRGVELIEEAVGNETIDAKFLFDIVARDLTTEGLDPYPLPYDGYLIYQGDTLHGAIRDHNAINREITQSCFVAEGIADGENPLLSMMWAMVGEPIMTPAIPLWMGSFSVPVEMVGHDPDSPMNLRLREVFEYIYYPFSDPYDDVVDTYNLIDGMGTGVLDQVRDFENLYYDYAQSLTDIWNLNYPGSADIMAVQDSLSALVFDFLLEPHAVSNAVLTKSGTDWVLSWPQVNTSALGDTINLAGYTIYRSDSPYTGGDSLAFTTDTSYIVDIIPGEDRWFYNIMSVWNPEY